MHDIVIVGAGTAGLSAAIYSIRAGKSVLLLEANSYGGQILSSPEVENYPGIKKISGFDFANNLYEQAVQLGAEMAYEKVTGLRVVGKRYFVLTDQGEHECLSVILATGAKNRPLGVAREADLIGAGISYCATCDGAFFRGKDVAVVGGGNTALEDATFLSNYCNKVYVIHRRDLFRGEEKVLTKLQQKDNVTFLLNSQVVALEGDSQLEGIVVQSKDNGEKDVVPVSGLFVAIGQMPENEVFADTIELDRGGYIKAAEDCKTNLPGVFVAGDCRTKTVRQLATAAADGAVAGLAACEFIS